MGSSKFYLLNTNVLFFLIAIIVSNFITKIMIFEMNIHTSIYPSTCVKLALICAVILSFFFSKKSTSVYIIVLIAAFILGILIELRTTEQKVILERCYYFLKHIFLFPLIPVVNSFEEKKFKKIINYLIIIGFFNTLLIIIGAVFEINIFKSYPNSSRFGYNGFLPIQGVGTFFYIFLVSISYYNIRENYNKYIFFLFCIGSLFLGTKSIFLFLFLVLMHYVYSIIHKKSIFYLLFIVVAALSLLFIKKISYFFLKVLNLDKQYFEENSVLTFLTSSRDKLFEQALNYISENWNILNYLIGGKAFKSIRVEFEIVDIFLFFGIIGVCIYVILIIKEFYMCNNLIYSFLLMSCLLIAMLAGNLFSSITNIFFFVITFIFLKKKNYYKKSNNNKC